MPKREKRRWAWAVVGMLSCLLGADAEAVTINGKTAEGKAGYTPCTYLPVDCVIINVPPTDLAAGRVAVSTSSIIAASSREQLLELYEAQYVVAEDLVAAHGASTRPRLGVRALAIGL